MDKERRMKMIFSEKSFFSFPKLPNTFIYFLIDREEVVYVGKTKQGIFRPLSHTDKEYEKVEIVPVSEDELDKKEGEYISKYKPKYNFVVSGYFSLLKVRNVLREKLPNNSLTVWDIRNAIKKSGVSVTKLNSVSYVSPHDLGVLEKVLMG